VYSKIRLRIRGSKRLTKAKRIWNFPKNLIVSYLCKINKEEYHKIYSNFQYGTLINSLVSKFYGAIKIVKVGYN
jgi:hypothetical protein